MMNPQMMVQLISTAKPREEKTIILGRSIKSCLLKNTVRCTHSSLVACAMMRYV